MPPAAPRRCTCGDSRPRLSGLGKSPADADAAAYKDFLTLWKDADPEIPILKEAKAEYAKLQLAGGRTAQ
jgi:hypothetical protein